MKNKYFHFPDFLSFWWINLNDARKAVQQQAALVLSFFGIFNIRLDMQFKCVLTILEILFLVTSKRLVSEKVILEERMRKWQIYIVPRRKVTTIWMKWMEIFCIYTEIDANIGRERSWVDVRDLSHMV